MGLYCLIEPHSRDESEIVKSVAQVSAEAFAEIGAYLDEWRKNERRVRLDVWDVTGEDADRFRMAFPETTNILRRVLAMVLDRTPKVMAYPADRETTAEAAKQMARLFSAIWSLEGYKSHIRRVVYQAMTYGVGIVYVAWHSERGYPVLKEVLPYDIAPAPGAGCLSDAPYFVRRHTMRGYDIMTRFDAKRDVLSKLRKIGGDQEQQRPSSWPVTDLISIDSDTGVARPSAIASVSKVSLSGAAGREAGKFDDELDAQYEVLEVWVRSDREKLWYRYFVSGEVLLYLASEDIPRYVDYRWCEQPKPSWVGLSLVSLLSYLQRFINTQFTSVATHTERTGDPVEAMTVDVAELQNHSYAIEGRRIILPPGTPPGGGTWWINPPPLAPDVLPSIQLVLAAMARVPGIDTLGQEDVQKTKRSATEMAQIAQRRHMVLRGDAEVLEDFLRRLATVVMNLIAHYQTEDLAIPAPDYIYSGEDVTVRQDTFKRLVEENGQLVLKPMKFSAVVDLGATLGIPKDQLGQLGFELYDRGIIDARALFEVFLDMPGGEALVAEAARRQQQAVEAIRGGANAALRRDNQQGEEGRPGAEDRLAAEAG